MEVKSIQVIQARIDQRAVVAQLMEFYIYDFAEILGLDINNNGRYDYEHLSLYWEGQDRFPFLIWIDERLAGLALIQRGSPIESDLNVWDVAEFFIMRKYRRMGAGQAAAHWIWSKHPGRWQIRVLASNHDANNFWKNTVMSFTTATALSSKRRLKEKDWFIYQFESLPCP